MNFYKRALELNDETVNNRRYLHKNAEVGLELPIARKYVMDKLTEYGLKPEKCGHGVVATVGDKSPVILLRADMDALPMMEESGEEFASTNGATHSCGHDMHTAMLLTAAKMLKENESELKGTVKFMFQPAEETFEGCIEMVDCGILENPKVDAALAFHVNTGRLPVTTYLYNEGGVMMASVDGFRIHIQGKGGHGAYPHQSIDPIQIGVHIYMALQGLIAREADPEKTIVLTVGKFCAGTASNIIPDTAVLEGTLRTNDSTNRNRLVNRIREVAEGVAKTYGGEVSITALSAGPPLLSEKVLTKQLVSFMNELDIPGLSGIGNTFSNASEDFAVIAEMIPTCYMDLSAGYDDERGDISLHNPRVRLNEDILPIGSSAYAHLAMRWLEENSK
ncbi:MAG: amidohydrolase [Anaerofustis stercorihominis]|nr:amidohydrolase [Anaerofustis stercorihominis]